jgi:hypothetical protein
MLYAVESKLFRPLHSSLILLLQIKIFQRFIQVPLFINVYIFVSF